MYLRPGFTPYCLVTTRRTQNAGFFWALTGGMESGPIRAGRPSVELRNVTLPANTAVIVGWQESHDNIVWPASTDTPGLFETTTSPVTLAVQSSEGLYRATVWQELTFTSRYLRWGVWVYNPTNTSLESCLAAIRVDTRSF